MRKRRAVKRDVLPDPVYNSKVITKLINQIMLDGKRGKAETIVYDAFDMIHERTGENANDVFKKAMENVTPALEVKARRVGGANYQIPFPVAGHRQLHYAFTWLVQSARSRKGIPYSQRLALEIVDAYNETGAAYKKKEDTHKMAEANRAFAHFART